MPQRWCAVPRGHSGDRGVEPGLFGAANPRSGNVLHDHGRRLRVDQLMRMLLAIACVACGGPPATPPHDATTEFTFAGAYTLDSTITSALVGSASYSTGQTIHVDRSFSSYAEAQGSSLTVTIV